MLYTVHVTAFCLGGPFFPDTVYIGLRLMYVLQKLQTCI